MPRIARSEKEKSQIYVDLYPVEFQLSNSSLSCKLCHCIVNSSKKSTVEQHRLTTRHQNSNKSDCLIQPSIRSTKWALKVTDAILSADIPLYKLRNEKIRKLFEKPEGPLPSETTCRNQVKTLYDSMLEDIKSHICGRDVFLMMDESEILGRNVVNTIIGKLEDPGKS